MIPDTVPLTRRECSALGHAVESANAERRKQHYLRLRKAGLRPCEAAREIGVTERTIFRYQKELRAEGRI